MKKYLIFILMFFCSSVFGSSSFNELGKNSKALENGFNFFDSPLRVVQKRWLPKKFLSEMSLGITPVFKGFNYMNSYSMDMVYHFFLNNHWSVALKYSWYSNSITQEGKDEVEKRSRIPLELRYPQKQSLLGGLSWSPFYGKTVFYNHLVRFDLYISFLGGMMELIDEDIPINENTLMDKNIFMGSLGLGLVFWWHKNFNTRLELQEFYYTYNIVSNRNQSDTIKEYLSKISISAGILF